MKTNNTIVKITISFILFFCIKLNAQIDPAIIWQNTMGGNLSDFMYQGVIDVNCKTNDRGFIIGCTSISDISCDKSDSNRGGSINFVDYWVIKLDSTGNIQWDKTYGGSGADVLTSIKQTRDGGYIIGGHSNSPISGEKLDSSLYDDYWILKLDAMGNIIWQKTLGGSSADLLQSTNLTSDGGYILAGTSISPISGDKTENSMSSFDFWILKLDSLGNVQWQNTINANSAEDLTKIFQTTDGGYFLSGQSNSDSSGDKTENSNGLSDIWVLKLDSIGNIIWQNTIGGSMGEFVSCAKECTDGGYIISSYTESPTGGDITDTNHGYSDFWIIRLSSTGNIIWNRTYGGDDYEFSSCIDQTTTGGFVLGGASSSSVSYMKSEPQIGDFDYWVLGLDSMGNILWENTIGGFDLDYLAHLECISDSTFFIYGFSTSQQGHDKSENNCSFDHDIWAMKIKSPINTIYGVVFIDSNNNCSLDSTIDIGRSNKIIQDLLSRNIAITNSYGYYSMPIYQDSALIYVSNLSAAENVVCSSWDSVLVNFDSITGSSYNVNLPITSQPCHALQVNISSTTPAPCLYSTYGILYSNEGFDTARGAYIQVYIDTSVLDNITSASPHSIIGDTIQFPIGTLAPYQSSYISFQAQVNCSAVIGTSTCVQAYIFPMSNCDTATSSYDSSDIEVMTNCNNDTVYVEVKNRVGAHDMVSPGIITVIQDEIIEQVTPFTLNAGASISLSQVLAPNTTFTIKVEQNSNHPLKPTIIIHDELCALTTPIKINSVINHFPRYDDAPSYEEVCSRILAAYDPNIKSVVPQGYTSQHYTDSNQILKYRIDFQNTGLDTARRVVLIDTLSNWLDVSTFVPLVSSHSYITQFVGSNIVHFIFDPISLPDSNASVPNSQGYVTFKIRPKYNTPKGTVINNFADIYFDYNAPVRTNTVFNTIYDTVLVRIGVGLNEPKENTEAQVLVFPNPTIDKFYIKLDQEVQDAHIKLVDVSGREIYQMNHIQGSEIEMKAAGISKGLYYIQIYNKHKLIARSKVLIQ